MSFAFLFPVVVRTGASSSTQYVVGEKPKTLNGEKPNTLNGEKPNTLNGARGQPSATIYTRFE
jgi:hypothetical protein